jgi:hypothetical protein
MDCGFRNCHFLWSARMDESRAFSHSFFLCFRCVRCASLFCAFTAAVAAASLVVERTGAATALLLCCWDSPRLVVGVVGRV